MSNYLGLELGSTRIKSVIIDDDHKVVQSGQHAWENRLIDNYWSYDLEDVRLGGRSSLENLDLNDLKAMGVSAMMHGYLAFDANNQLITPFRTWRNTNTTVAASKLTELFGFNIPLRWSVAHLYQAILDGDPRVKEVAFITTLAGYVHWVLTGEKVLGVGDGSGMFPLENGDYNPKFVKQFASLTSIDWPSLAPRLLKAGEPAGYLTSVGAEYLGLPSSLVGLPLCPPEGDAGTGMVATNSITPRNGSVSAGTSVFAMVVLERALKHVHPTIDVVSTPDGFDVAMVHCNECTTRIDGWVKLFGEVLNLFGHETDKGKLFSNLYEVAIANDDSALAKFMHERLTDAVSELGDGIKILVEDEGVSIDSLTGHGGYFKSGQAGRTVLSQTLGIPINLLAHASEGGAWGAAVLATYLSASGQSLNSYVKSIFEKQ
jgi:sugar (pentulose or hexulose) kinase